MGDGNGSYVRFMQKFDEEKESERGMAPGGRGFWAGDWDLFPPSPVSSEPPNSLLFVATLTRHPLVTFSLTRC